MDYVDPSGAGNILLTPIVDGGPLNPFGPENIQVDLSAYAGMTIRIRFALATTEDYFDVLLDDVRITSTSQETP